MKPLIKVCGIKKQEEVTLLNQYPVAYMGFIFAKSKRQVTIDQAKVLRTMVRGDIKVVGVFMNQPIEFVQEAIRSCQLDLVQLHGDESDDIIGQCQVPVWKSIAVKGKESLALLDKYPRAQGLLLDTYHKGASGGTGKQFNWNLIKDYQGHQTLILAGGLSPENVHEAIQAVHPHVLDLNSGLETDLIKDPVKVAALFKALKE